MTEQESKTKPCFKTYAPPTVGLPDPAFPGHMLGYRDGGFQMRCIGSECMAWRWDDSESLDKPTRVHPNVLKTHWLGWTITDATPDANGYVEISPPAPKLPHGHCGLAGKP